MTKQETLNIQIQNEIKTVEEYKFEPIKGYPMLHWKGKRPFNSTQYYPAQLKENYGEEVNGWMNKIFWGDNLQVMSHLLKEYRGKVDLVYIDPPYDSKADYKKTIKLNGKSVSNSHLGFEEKQYSDIWTNDEYLQFMYERIMLIKELLNDTGAVYIHLDWRKNHYLRMILDEIFGADKFQNEIIWHYSGWNKKNASYFNKRHDTILYYSKKGNPKFSPYRKDWESKEQYVKQRKQKLHVEENTGKEFVYSDAGNGTRVKRYIEDALKEGRHIDDVWKIDKLNNSDKSKTNYPTQKPELLIERIIASNTSAGDIVFDCFMGSGTTQSVAMKMGRKFIGADINLGAIETTLKRLNKVSRELVDKSNTLDLDTTEPKDYYTGFSVYNVNNYDVFRNPVEAKEILKKALEIQPLPHNTLYDGEKDGRMVKIMPVNRIATRADLTELITGFNQSKFQKLYDESPNKPVEKILLVCMGHEPDLAANLEKEMKPFKLDVEVVDILRDKSNLEFKRDSEAKIELVKDKLVIQNFYPMNLLQKLSLMKENVGDWKELTESIKIDWNYDGSVFEPKLVDLPEKNELVKGEYGIPEDSGTIRVKITDLLSESLEMVLEV